MKRRIDVGIIAVIAIALLLAGCQNAAPTDPTEFEYTVQWAVEKNAQNQYLVMDGVNFQEADGFFCGTIVGDKYLRYYDKASGISGVLCADPSCAHDSNACGAYIQHHGSLSYYDGKLYWVGTEGSELRKRYLWQSDVSGMNRKKVMEIPFEEIIMTYQPQRYVLHQGRLYIMGRASVVNGTQTGYRVSLLSTPLGGDEGFTTVYDEVFPSGVNEAYRFVGDSIYISMITFDDLTSRDLCVTKVDMQKNTSEIIYQETDMPENPGDIWVTEAHEIYLPGITETEKEAYLWKLENNTKKVITSWSGDRLSMPDVMDGMVLCLSYDDDIRWADIRDFDGNIIYSGKLFPNEIPGLDRDPNAIPGAIGWDNACSIGLIGGDEEKLIIELESQKGTKLDVRFDCYTILLDLQNDMKAKILWSNEE